jgi:sec-independent protein translocase protein TatA
MINGWEWIIVGIIAIVFIIWGPSKIPELAKALGKARGEFSKASKEFENAAKMTENEPEMPAKTKIIKTDEEILLDTAHSLGIETKGKTKEQIADEVEAKVRLLGSK